VPDNAKKSKYSSHSLRAGYVVSQYRSGKDLEEIQKDIKHEDLNQTNAYLVDAKRDRKKVDGKNIPVDVDVGDIDIEMLKKLKGAGLI
jgi:site-specific recombinase XerD